MSKLPTQTKPKEEPKLRNINSEEKLEKQKEQSKGTKLQRVTNPIFEIYNLRERKKKCNKNNQN